MAHNVRVRVLSSFDAPDAPGPGTLICGEDEIVEKKIVSGVTAHREEAKISLLAVPDAPGKAAQIFTLLAAANINVDMIVQSPSRAPGGANISFTIPEGDLDRAVALLNDAKGAIGYSALQSDRNVAKITVTGVGMKSHAGVAATMFKTLGDRGINIQNISTSEIKISVLIESEYAELAVRALHGAYGLDRETGSAGTA
jgi:aspartate kinase